MGALSVVALIGALCITSTTARQIPVRLTVGNRSDRRRGSQVSTPRKTPVPKAPDDAALAWELAATARPYLSRAEADGIFITLGIGETFAAIDALITALAANHVPLGDDLVATTDNWLDCYLGQDAEPRLRHLLTEVIAASPQPEVPAADERTDTGRHTAQDRCRQAG